jgi:hypothetical protein
MTFDPQSIKTFYFIDCNFDEVNRTASFYYAFDNGLTFKEQLIFREAQCPLSDAQRSALQHCLNHLHLVLGISYYKAATPPIIKTNRFKLSQEAAVFYDDLYKNGLGEFAYRQNLDLSNHIHFPYSTSTKTQSANIDLPRRTVIPVGGGKDSIVTIETFKSITEECDNFKLLSLGDFTVTREVAQQAKRPCIIIERKLSPTLFKINKEGAFNGHVPISAIIAFILPVAAILYGFDRAALSNERSANVANLTRAGEAINHQYSKSYDFEVKVAAFIQNHVLRSFLYFSFLRPLSDLHIAKLFSRLTPYHSIFMSCNKAFRQNKSARTTLWCLDCPKCRFTFLALAPFITKIDLLKIFGVNLLNQPNQVTEYDKLIGINGHKPFECVGEVEESLAAFTLLSQKSEWQSDRLVNRFIKQILPTLHAPEKLVTLALTPSPIHSLPSTYAQVLLNAYS